MSTIIFNTIRAKEIGELPLFTEHEGEKKLDFNKIIPMPESLKGITSDQCLEDSVMYFLTDKCRIAPASLDQEKKNILKEVMRYHINDIFSNVQDEISNKRYVEDKLYAKGKQHVEDYLQYGAMTSIDWSYKNWGTQGNAVSCKTNPDEIQFYTINGVPEKILKEISRSYHLSIEHWWKSEDDREEHYVVYTDGNKKHNAKSLKRNENKEIARVHTCIMEEQYANEIAYCIRRTTEYSALSTSETHGAMPDVIIDDIDTVSAIMKYGYGDTATLNFASYTEPGGKFLKGGMAQEESLCHASFLYNVLSDCAYQSYYQWNREHKNGGLYENRALYSPDVLFFQGEKVRNSDVITCSAPNLHSAQKRHDASAKDNAEVLNSRIQFILDIADSNWVDTLILGAWGCGAFGQDPEEVARAFKRNLPGRRVKKVIFAIPHGGNFALQTFKRVFNSKQNFYQGVSDPYKKKMIDIMVKNTEKDEYFNAQVCSAVTKNINLDENALRILQSYYEGKKIKIEED